MIRKANSCKSLESCEFVRYYEILKFQVKKKYFVGDTSSIFNERGRNLAHKSDNWSGSMNHAEAAIPLLHKHRRLIGPSNSISWAVGSTVRYEAKARVSSCGPRSFLVGASSFFFPYCALPSEPSHEYLYVRPPRCRRRAESMQAPCTICAQVNTCSGIPAARHKPPSLHKRSNAYRIYSFPAVLSRGA